MAYRDMTAELCGRIPKLPRNLSGTFINRALENICDKSAWSFQLGEGAWLTPKVITTGKATTTLGSNIVTGDAFAAPAWIAGSTMIQPITARQFRAPAYSLYNIIKFDGVNTLTLDRPWLEPAVGAISYQIYQAYYPAPVQNFKRFLAVRDFTNAADLNFWQFFQSSLAADDPQRTVFNNPDRVVPYKQDTRTGSATLGWMMYELYPHQLAQLPYALYYLTRSPKLVSPTDTVPYPLTEEVVLDRARVLAYEWKESQKGEEVTRGSGANWPLLMQAAEKLYDSRIAEIRKIDRDLADSFLTKISRMQNVPGAPFYSAITGSATVGSWNR